MEGLASYYGGKFHGRKTASGERYDKTQFSAASNRFPIGTRVAVLRPVNGLCVIVRINDRMHRRHRVRVIDVSKGAADYLEMLKAGVVKVRVAPLRADWLQRGPLACADAFAPENCPDCGRPQESGAAVGDPADVEYNPAGIVTLRSETGLSAQ